MKHTLPFSMKEIVEMTRDAFVNGLRHVLIGDMPFPIHFIHNDGYPQYGLMSPCGEIVRLVEYGPGSVAAYPA